jgi:VIT1/CCC1 family predicted Fe2+/Mn2+ transporter
VPYGFHQEILVSLPPIAKSGRPRPEKHFVTRIGWLRAAVLGANDGLLSTSSLMVGVAAASVGPSQLLLTGVAGIVAGAMSMAAGEYVSVSSQADSEKADIERERRELQADPERERQELAAIYVRRGVPRPLALEVADALSKKDVLGAHARDELGITDTSLANPVQAAMASAASFIIGGLPAIIAVLAAPQSFAIWAIAFVAILTLGMLGAAGGRVGGAPVLPGVLRVMVWGSLAMAVTAGVGHLFQASAG